MKLFYRILRRRTHRQGKEFLLGWPVWNLKFVRLKIKNLSLVLLQTILLCFTHHPGQNSTSLEGEIAWENSNLYLLAIGAKQPPVPLRLKM